MAAICYSDPIWIISSEIVLLLWRIIRAKESVKKSYQIQKVFLQDLRV